MKGERHTIIISITHCSWNPSSCTGLKFLGESCFCFPSITKLVLVNIEGELEADWTALLVLSLAVILGLRKGWVLVTCLPQDLLPVSRALCERKTAGECCLGVAGVDLTTKSVAVVLDVGISTSSRSSMVIERESSILLPRLDVSKAAYSVIFCILSCSMSVVQNDLAASCAIRDPSGIPWLSRGELLHDLDFGKLPLVLPSTSSSISVKLDCSLSGGRLSALLGRKFSSLPTVTVPVLKEYIECKNYSNLRTAKQLPSPFITKDSIDKSSILYWVT